MTGKPRILLTRALPEAVEARLRAGFDVTANPDDAVMPPDRLRELAAGQDGVICNPTDDMGEKAILALPAGIRILATFSVGYEHINLAAAKARGIFVTNTPGAVTAATAEIALLLLLGAARRAAEGEAMMRAGSWGGWSPTQLLGTGLRGRTLGIVGMGRIGRAVADMARAFGMTIRYHNRTRLAASLEGDARFHATLDAMLPLCDAVSLHCPATPETRGLMNERSLALLPDGAILVNTARGGVVDDEALLAELRRGRLRAGLDVYANEPRVHPGYAALPNTFLLPHLGTATLGTRTAMGMRVIDNLEAFFSGAEPRDRLS